MLPLFIPHDQFPTVPEGSVMLTSEQGRVRVPAHDLVVPLEDHGGLTLVQGSIRRPNFLSRLVDLTDRINHFLRKV